jgi:predicted O-methyltransferase YrrM
VTSTLGSDRVQAVLARLQAAGEVEDERYRRRVAEREAELGMKLYGRERAEFGISAPLAVTPLIGQVLYALTVAARPRFIVEFGTSLGFSTIHFACALRDVGAGSVLTTELLPEKAEQAERNLADAGLEHLVEIRTGDALESLSGIGAELDLLFLDGSNDLYMPVLRQLEPYLSRRAIVLGDMSAGDPHHDSYREHVRATYLTTELPIGAGLVMSVRPSGIIDLEPTQAAGESSR